jgi:hypothetical protein
MFHQHTAAGIIDATLGDATKKLDKAKFAYEHLPPEFKRAFPLRADSATTMEFKNGSRIEVGTSHRGGTLQMLHVSEMGKIAAENPKRSREIRSGAFGTLHEGSMCWVESTAKGAAGDFYDLVGDAGETQASGRALKRQEFKLIFLPWQMRSEYRLDPDGVLITKELAEYFTYLEATHGVKLDAHQRAWYAVTMKRIGPEEMWSEYPSYPAEAFKVSMEGAYFKTQLTKAREQRRIGRVPIDPSRPVNTFWDIGKSDNTSIWFHQNMGHMHHFVHYYENSGEGTPHYVTYLREFQERENITWGKHFGPHDLNNTAWILSGQKRIVDVAAELGIRFTVVPRIPNKADAIEVGRNMLHLSWIDEENCAQGVRCLDNYRKKWDEKNGRYMDEPLHNWASHGADAFMTGACGFRPEATRPPPDRYSRRPRLKSAWSA